MPQPIWKPSEARIAEANLTRFMRSVEDRYDVALPDYDALWRWSVEQPESFWPSVWEFCGIVSSRPWDTVLSDGDQMPGARWFEGARLNFAENLLRRRDEQPAIVSWNEQGRQRSLTFAELYWQVAQLAEGLRRRGVGPESRVAAFMPNLPETAIMMLAATSLGATFSSCSPDFGVAGALDRFGQIEPNVLLTADGYQYAGKAFASLPRVREMVEAMPSIETTVAVPYQQDRPNVEGLRGGVLFADLQVPDATEIEFAQLPFDHPLYILFSSGTTGVPKCIVHSAGGTLLQQQKEHVLNVDLGPEDRLFYFTTCGWMMWNWLTTGLATGSTVVLYDGSPFHPSSNILFDTVDAEGVTVFGTSPKYLSSLEKAEAEPIKTHDLSSLRTIVSTGAPLAAEGFDYVYDKISSDVHLASISGGTDIVSCFALGVPIDPVYRGEIQARGLGMNVAVFDDAGNSIEQDKGELVCTSPFPSMPLGFWNDTDGSRYRATYFERFPGLWHHGDYTEITERGTVVIYGRSDAVLNPGGVRIGTAEIYRQVEQLPEVIESIVVGQQWESDVRVVLFVRLRDGCSLDEELIDRIKQQIRSGATPRHVPSRVVAVEDIPRTKSGKIVELAVRHVIHNRPVTNTHALANPEALEFFRDREELKT